MASAIEHQTQGNRERKWRDYRARFIDAPHKDVTIWIIGPNGGNHPAGEWTLDEMVELASDILSEVERRRTEGSKQ